MGRGEVRKQVEYPAKNMEHCFLHFDDMRAADCKKLAESPEGDFRQTQRKQESCFLFSVFLASFSQGIH